MLKWAGTFDTVRICLIHDARGDDVYQLNIPPDFELATEDYFDKQVMNDLFTVGHLLGSDPRSWQTKPPQLKGF
ncbi:MAG: hypothetical protein CMM46_09595 [Rhodospirillaceae bacterium]|nr:hypothetical protein [Rhodospirillaceae bacterium]|tara:strand:- start:5364 stop:5585 length:222 start_codon:yes stop_codon:yes gene_type:complete